MHPTVHEYAVKLAEKMPGNLKVKEYLLHFQTKYFDMFSILSNIAHPPLFYKT